MRKKLFGLQGKMMLSYSVILGLAVVLLMGTAYRYLVAVSTQNAEINLQQLATKTLAQAENYLLEMDKMAQQVAADTKIINTFSLLQESGTENYFEKNIMESIDIATLLASYNGPSAPIWRISLYDQYGDFISSGANVSRKLQAQWPSVVASLLSESNGKALVTPPETDHWSQLYGQALFVSLYRPITDYYARQVYGVVEIQQNLDKLVSAISLDARANTYVFVFDQDGVQVLPTDMRFESVENESFYITRQTSSQFGWSVALVQSRSEIIRPYQSLISILFMGGAALLLGILLFVYITSRRFSKPIVELSKKVREISIASIPSEIATQGHPDEVRELNTAFNFMLKRLQDSISTEQRSYLLALQTQMDPHFLFNTLSVISGMGLEGGNENVVDACEKLANMLRYSASYDTRSSMLRDEIENVQNYLELMKLRFEENFSYTLLADESLASLPVPRLILQPVVENCFEHGFSGADLPWEIRISISGDGEGWRISIADNGKGISEKSRRELSEKVELYRKDISSNYKEMKLGGMGLVNTIIRLKLFYNEDFDYDIKNLSPSGTEVILKGGRP